MKYFITAFIGACMISACQPSPPPTDTTDYTMPEPDPEALKTAFLGTYKGDFGGSPIYITINYFQNNKLAGYDTHKGLRRNVSGTATDKGFKWAIQLSEPGDHEYDGVFSLVMERSESGLRGVWRPLNSKSLTEKHIVLTKFKEDEKAPGFFSGDHRDVFFDNDGSCTLNYYEKVNDSTFSEQMITLRGTWEQQSHDYIVVNWQPNPAYELRSTIFTMRYVLSGNGKDSIPVEAKGDIFSFSKGEF